MTDPWHLGVMCAFDTETTAADPEAARLVTACIAYVDGTGKIPPESQDWLLNPDVDIPAEATAVHGVTTEHAREYGLLPALALGQITAELLRSAAAGIPIVAYNAPYDFTVLDRETRRNDLEPFGPELDAAKAFIVDPYVLDKALDPYRKGKRTLTAAAGHYRVKAEEAHSASGDAVTAARVAWKIATVYPHIGRMSPTELHAFQVKAKRNQAMSFRAYLTSQGKEEQVDGSWPLRPWSEEEAVA